MPVQTSQTFTTETGSQTAIVVPRNQVVTIGIASGGSDSITIEVQLSTGGTKYVAEATLNGNVARSFTGPIVGIGINIVTNVSNDIKTEIVTGGTIG